MSWLTDVIATVEAFGKKVNHYATDIGSNIKDVFSTTHKPGESTGFTEITKPARAIVHEYTTTPTHPDKGKTGAKGKGKKKPKGPTVTRAQQYEQEIASSPYNQIMQAVGKEYAVAQQAAQSAASGSLTAPATQGAWSQALQDLQGAPSSLGMNPSAWLGQNLATEAKTTAPLQQAMSNYGSALQAQQGPIEANLNALGQGLGAEDVTASASAWLSALASHVTANLSYYGEIPQASVGSLSPAVAQALQKSGGYLSGTSKGLVPLSSLTTKGASTKAAKTATGPGTTLSAAGSAPSTGPANAGG